MPGCVYVCCQKPSSAEVLWCCAGSVCGVWPVGILQLILFEGAPKLLGLVEFV